MHGPRSGPAGAVPGRTRLLVAAFAGAAAVGGSFVAAGLTEAFVGTAVARGLLGVLPDPVFGYGITVLGNAAQPALLVGATILAAFALALAAVGADAAAELVPIREPPALRGVARPLTAGLLAGAFAGAFALIATGDPRSSVGSGVAAALTVTAGRSRAAGRDVERPASGGRTSGGRASGGPRRGGDRGAAAEESGGTTRMARVVGRRRPVLRAGAVLAGTLGASGALARFRGDFAPPERSPSDPRRDVEDPLVLALLDRAERRSFEFDALDPLVSRGFYRVDINLTEDPDVSPDEWRLSIGGAVDESLTLTYADVTARPVEHRFVTLRCVGDQLNGYKIDTALWTGTPLAPILDEAGAGEECCVRLAAADGYYHAFPRAALERGFLAWGMNGKPLPEAHGAPVRVLIPGHWGEINVKWVTDIEVREEPATGFWEERGWHGSGPVETVAKIHVVTRESGEGDGDGANEDGTNEGGANADEKGRVVVAGHAYAGTRGVDRVEVSTDGGETWTEGDLSEPLPGATPADGAPSSASAADAWRMWRHEYVDPSEHEVTARVVEADGTVQSSEQSDAFPRGATGWVSREVYAARE